MREQGQGRGIPKQVQRLYLPGFLTLMCPDLLHFQGNGVREENNRLEL